MTYLLLICDNAQSPFAWELWSRPCVHGSLPTASTCDEAIHHGSGVTHVESAPLVEASLNASICCAIKTYGVGATKEWNVNKSLSIPLLRPFASAYILDSHSLCVAFLTFLE